MLNNSQCYKNCEFHIQQYQNYITDAALIEIIHNTIDSLYITVEYNLILDTVRKDKSWHFTQWTHNEDRP